MADCCRPEVASDIIYGQIEDGVEMSSYANFGDSGVSVLFLIPSTHPPARTVRYDNTCSRSKLRRAVKKVAEFFKALTTINV